MAGVRRGALTAGWRCVDTVVPSTIRPVISSLICLFFCVLRPPALSPPFPCHRPVQGSKAQSLITFININMDERDYRRGKT